MEEEIDLRVYVLVLLKYWKWILGTTVAAAAVALVVSFILPPTYEAVALVVVTKPRYVMRFDLRIESVSDTQPAYKAYPELAASDEVLQELLAQLKSRPERLGVLEGLTLGGLQEMVRAKPGADSSVIRLAVRHRDPEASAYIANLWAEIFVQRANEVYGTAGGVQLASRAAVPEKPVSPRKLPNATVAGALGLALAVLGAFVVEWWRGGKK